MPHSTTAMRVFIQAEHFAVIGRVLTDRSRFDNKVSAARDTLTFADKVVEVLRWSAAQTPFATSDELGTKINNCR
jgi:hypothetical protein